MGAVRLPVAWAMAVVGLFAVFHGYAHALEAPPNGAGSYILGFLAATATSPGACGAPADGPASYVWGFLAATAVLQGVGLALGWVVHRAVGDLGVRALGGVV